MKEQEISDGLARKGMLPVVNALFMGVTLKLPQGRLCYRGANEVLPDLPGAASDEGAVASQEGLFHSAFAYAASQQVDERWLYSGDLGMLQHMLEVLEAPPDLVVWISLDREIGSALSQSPSGRSAESIVLNLENWRGAQKQRPRGERYA